MYVRNLYVNAQIQPLGLDSRQPTLSWNLASAGERMEIQTAYRVLVSTNEHATGQEQGDVWDSGIVRSRRQFGIEYEGIPLISRKRYYWKVQIWDNHDHMSESHISWWEMGLLRADDWSARWIGHRAAEVGTDNDLSMPLFRHEFLTRKSISRARAYVCGLGQYELRINGCKVEDHVLEPGWTHYDRTCLYKAYDITKLLTADQHAVGVMLGNGFYHVTSGGRYAKYEKSFGRPKCIVQIEIEYTDGTTETIGSNAEWASTKGPITFSTVYGGRLRCAAVAVRLGSAIFCCTVFLAEGGGNVSAARSTQVGQVIADKGHANLSTAPNYAHRIKQIRLRSRTKLLRMGQRRNPGTFKFACENHSGRAVERRRYRKPEMDGFSE